MSYFLTTEVSTAGLIKYNTKTSIDFMFFQKGARKDVSDVNIFLSASQKSIQKIQDYHLVSTIGPTLISAKLKNIILDIVPEEVDIYSAPIECNGVIFDSFYAIRPKSLIECCDLGASEYEVEEIDQYEKSYRFLYCALQKDIPYGMQIVRCEEFPRLIVVGDSIKEACFEAKLKGLLFAQSIDFTPKGRGIGDKVK